MATGTSFQVLSSSGVARLGRLETAHGEIPTPAFMPVGTLGAVKGLGPAQLEESGASVMLANLYHLAVRPGIDVITELGGLHAYSGWHRPILTDSGGYQVFSLGALRRVHDDGVTFRNHHDGRALSFTPELVVEMQDVLGVDIAMMLDECPPWPVSREAAAEALERTNLWARRARAVSLSGSSLFGIVQGSFFPDLRELAVRELVAMDFDGYAIGGVSVGEPVDSGRRVIETVARELPWSKPRYLMGLGTPLDLLHGVENGIDLFDCVLPSRNARHGVLFTRRGALRIKNSRFRRDPLPPDPECACGTCARTSRAFLHHLFRCGELTAKVLATAHNLRFYLDFMSDLRQALESGTLAETAADVIKRYGVGAAARTTGPD